MKKLLVSLLFAAGLPLAAQTDRGAITGTVTDRTGARVSTASVTVMSLATTVARPSKTNDEASSPSRRCNPGPIR